MRVPQTLPVLIAVALALLAPAAVAQGVYKYTDPTGRITYTDDPTAGGGAARPVETPAPTGAAVSTAGLSDADRKLLEQAKQRAASLDRAVADIVTANAELRAAEAQREQGIEPAEGDRQGRRYRPEYWERQRANQRAIENARARLDDAIERRNALR
jgi:Domain of unknown function (DUF4124)